ncbi:hypothetical protein EMIT0P260_20145 [Pseudomonas sp. IT-P260]
MPALAPQNTQTDLRDMPSSWVNPSQGNGWQASIQGLDFAFWRFKGTAGATGVGGEQTAQQTVKEHDRHSVSVDAPIIGPAGKSGR